MIGAQLLFEDCQRLLVSFARFRVKAPRGEHVRKITGGDTGAHVRGAESIFQDGERAAGMGLGFGGTLGVG